MGYGFSRIGQYIWEGIQAGMEIVSFLALVSYDALIRQFKHDKADNDLREPSRKRLTSFFDP